MTRWSTKDLTGMLVKNQTEVKADQWHVVEFPALLDHGPVWPEYWKQDELEKVKATLPVAKWNAQWMQQPTSEEGAILKRDWSRKYTKQITPCFFFMKSVLVLFKALKILSRKLLIYLEGNSHVI